MFYHYATTFLAWRLHIFLWGKRFFNLITDPKKHIVRVEVKYGQNVNDPEVTDTILQWVSIKCIENMQGKRVNCVLMQVEFMYQWWRTDFVLQIKQKLKDHGIEDTRLRWNVQPDGNVFSRKLEKSGLNSTRCSVSLSNI